MRTISAVLVAALCGCASAEHTARQQQDAQDAYQFHLRSTCRVTFGFEPGTEGHSNCMMQLHLAEQQRRGAMGAALIQSGALNPRPVPQIQLAPMQPIQQRPATNCYATGPGTMRCN